MESDLTKQTYKQLLRKDFDFTNFDLPTFAGLTSEIIESRELYQKVIGKFASAITIKYGEGNLKKFAQMIEEQSGRKISTNTLISYRWVWDKVKDLDLPEDFPYSSYRDLASTENPQEWINKAVSEGWSPAQLRREIRLSRGLDNNFIICPTCGQKVKNAKKPES